MLDRKGGLVHDKEDESKKGMEWRNIVTYYLAVQGATETKNHVIFQNPFFQVHNFRL